MTAPENWTLTPAARARLADFLRLGGERMAELARKLPDGVENATLALNAGLWAGNAFKLAGELVAPAEVDVTLQPTSVEQLRDQLRADEAKRAAMSPERRALDNGHDPDCDCTACADADAHAGGRSCGSEWCGRCTS